MPEMGESVTEGTVLEWHVVGGRFGRGGPDDGRGLDRQGRRRGPRARRRHRDQDPGPARRGRSRSASRWPRSTPTAAGRPARRPPRRRRSGDEPAPRRPRPSRTAPVRPERRPPRTARRPTDDASVSAGKALEGGGLEIVMPEMGESVTEGTVLEWHVAEGDQIAEGDTVVEVSTDKVDAEVPAPASGTITKILVGPDETIEVGKPLAEMTKGEAPRWRRRPGCQASAPTPDTPRQAKRRSDRAGADGRSRRRRGPEATPVARRAAQANGVDLTGVKGSGRRAARSPRPTCSPAGEATAPRRRRAGGRGHSRCAAPPRRSPRR